jgi:hypothetical protein
MGRYYSIKQSRVHAPLLEAHIFTAGDLFTKKSGGESGEVDGGQAGGGSQGGGYYGAAYAREQGARGKEEKGEKGGAAVIPICLPLCCAAPCVIL